MSRVLMFGIVATISAVFAFSSGEVSAQNAYITNFSSDTVSVINTVTNTVTATVGVGNAPYGVSVSPDGSKVYVTN